MNVQKSLCRLTRVASGNVTLARAASGGPISAPKLVTKPFDEVRIEMPWGGHIAGKWYGPKNVRPILGLHGWQDNAGTYDTLAPLLPPHLSFFCIDVPGHGLSSWLPKGMAYHSIDNVQLILRIMKEYKWDKVSLMGHSMSSFTSFVFAALFPDKCDMLIGLDTLNPPVRSSEKYISAFIERMEGQMKFEELMQNDSEPPAYEWDQMIDKLHVGSNKSINREACQYLLQRNCKESSKQPHKYYFSRDNRVKTAQFFNFNIELVLDMASRIKCPHLFIKATDSPYFQQKEFYDTVMAQLKKNPLFENHSVDGTHHVHLNEPEKVAPIMNAFINKCRPA